MLKGHGGNLYEAALSAGVDPSSVLDFSASVNRMADRNQLKTWLAESAGQIGDYPDPEYHHLRKLIGAHYAISPDAVLPGNGSTELLYLVPRVLGAKKGLVVSPCYADYADALRLAGASIDRIYLHKNNAFTLDYGKLGERLQDGFDAVVIGAPNNPTGTVAIPADLRNFMTKYPDTLFLIDESFADFAPSLTLFPSIPANAVVLRSFTKFYGIPGLRAGFAAAPLPVIEKLKAAKEPWTLNSSAEYICRKLLEEGMNDETMRLEINRQRDRLAALLGGIPGLRVFTTSANYLLVEIESKILTAAALKSLLLSKEKILIRDCGNFDGLDAYWFRVSVRDETANARLGVALRGALCTDSQ